MNVLLVEPAFPKPSKSKNHKDFIPIGLLKLATYHKKKNNAICIVRGEVSKDEIFFEFINGRKSKNLIPDQVLITSYFTYWSKYVRTSVSHYKRLYPRAKIVVGGIYASLMPEHCKKYTRCDEVYVGVHPKAEKCAPAYKYIEKHYGPIDYQIIHTSRGCIRRCEFCGVYKIEPKFTCKSSIVKEIKKRKIIFYDNNLLANPYIEDILTELVYLKEKKRILWCESQSGLDGRLIAKNPDLAYLLKEAGFKNIRISWDGPLKDQGKIKRQIDIIKRARFKIREDVFIFMIYNWDISYEEMEKKRIKCWDWRVQILDCRYRPLTQTFDNYNPHLYRKGQTGRDYHIHRASGWTDKKVREFRKHIRRQNMCVRFNIPFYTDVIERKYLRKGVTKDLIYIARNCKQINLEEFLIQMKIPYWFPQNFNGNGLYITKEDLYHEFEGLSEEPAIFKGKETNSFKQWRNTSQNQILKTIF